MFEKTFLKCPNCETTITERARENNEVDCMACGRRFQVMGDEAGTHVALADISAQRIVEPLYLPRGSIRAFVTLILAVSCWVLVCAAVLGWGLLTGIHAKYPHAFLALTAVVSFYFGSRS